MKIKQKLALAMTALLALGSSSVMANTEDGIKNLPTDGLAWETTAE